VKLILAGGAAAVALGALSGHAMHPDLLAAAERPAGPQILADGTDGATDSGAAILAAYHGQPPDYVLGTDTTRPASWLNGEPAITRARYEAAPHADDPDLYADSDDTTAAERDPNDPSREPAYDRTPADRSYERPAYSAPAPRRVAANTARYAPAYVQSYAPGYAPRYGEDRPSPAYERPAYGRPAYDRPAYDRPAYDRPADDSDDADEPTGA